VDGWCCSIERHAARGVSAAASTASAAVEQYLNVGETKRPTFVGREGGMFAAAYGCANCRGGRHSRYVMLCGGCL
jgi:hypothetical protein